MISIFCRYYLFPNRLWNSTLYTMAAIFAVCTVVRLLWASCKGKLVFGCSDCPALWLFESYSDHAGATSPDLWCLPSSMKPNGKYWKQKLSYTAATLFTKTAPWSIVQSLPDNISRAFCWVDSKHCEVGEDTLIYITKPQESDKFHHSARVFHAENGMRCEECYIHGSKPSQTS